MLKRRGNPAKCQVVVKLGSCTILKLFLNLSDSESIIDCDIRIKFINLKTVCR